MNTGPPGTGKTTTISAASRIWDLCRFPVWIVAHSNVAVKNIAETLFKRGVDFKLIVSKEFYVEWYVHSPARHSAHIGAQQHPFLDVRHEHLYCEIQGKVRRSDELPTQKVAMERELGGSYIILSTLSMISNPSLHDNGTFDIIPVERLIIDEASQINIFEFMVGDYFPSPPISQHSGSCSTYSLGFNQGFRKFVSSVTPSSVSSSACLIWSLSKQIKVPPFGQDNVPSIKTIFDLTLKSHPKHCFFLNIQCSPIPTHWCHLCLMPSSTCRPDATADWQLHIKQCL
jgi:regulator of nonsense transcripts 1